MSTLAADKTYPHQDRRRVPRHGESFIATLGAGMMIILLATLFGAAWWSIREHLTQLEITRRDQVHAVAEFLGQSAETMLGSGQLSGLRRLVSEAKRDHRLLECRITLPDGRVLVDAEPSKVNLASLPASWPSGPLDSRAEASAADEIVVTRCLLVPGRGPAILSIRAGRGVQTNRTMELIAGFGILGIASLLALILMYRRLRTRLMGVSLIRESLLAFTLGERSPQALTVARHLGPEAAAWNGVLRELDKAKQDKSARSMSDQLDRRCETRNEMELACDSLTVGLAIVDATGLVRQANGAAASLLKVPREKLIGHVIGQLLEDGAAKAAVEAIFGSTSPQRRSVEFTRQEQGLASVLRLSVRPLRKEDTNSALVMIEDITQQRIAEAARNSFVTQATHELRTPLTNMRLCLETAVDEGSDDPAIQAACFNTLNQETRRLDRIITGMLSLAEIEAGAMRLRTDDVRLDSLFDELRADFEPLAKEKRIELRFDLPPKFPVLQGDRDKLVLALHNLVGNAIKYTPDGGRVTVVLRVETDRIVIEIADTGIGIDEGERELVFEKFYRAKDPRVAKITGSGLGLALSREVARRHGGDVTLQSEVNQGSTFTLTVPMLTKAA